MKVRLPGSVEPMAKGLILSGEEIIKAIKTPLERKSQGTMKQLLKSSANTLKATEAQEAEWIQKFGDYVEVARMMAGKPDPASQDRDSSVRLINYQNLVGNFRILLGLAIDFSWDKYMNEQRKKYQDPANLPKEVEVEILAKYQKYQQVKNLIDRDPYAGQIPRFLVVNFSGQEFFRSIPGLDVS